MTKITAPNPDYKGTDTYGSTVLEFEDGTAEVDELPDSVRGYLQSAGYGVDGKAAEQDNPVKSLAPSFDPRDHADAEQLGTRLRDAAVDPQPEDFLPPLNAGKEGEEGNPHGPNVVSPGIHAMEGKPVVPGAVGRVEEQETDDGTVKVVVSDTDRQQGRESELADRILINDEPVTDVTQDMGDSLQPPETLDAQSGEAVAVNFGGTDEAEEAYGTELADHTADSDDAHYAGSLARIQGGTDGDGTDGDPPKRGRKAKS
jgi:hypothetical protein